MTLEEIRPTTEEVRSHLLSTLKHSCQVEYYFDHFSIGTDDPQRAHDISKRGSKYSWPVLKGLAIQNRNDDPVFFEVYVLPSILEHRKYQYHHRKWNHYNPHATTDDLMAGGIDTICSLLDNRKYNGGAHSFNGVLRHIKTGEPHQIKWILHAYDMMKDVAEPDLEVITSLDNIPNIGLMLYDDIARKTYAAVEMLRKKYGYSDL
jgi:hypothetical protein